jgi:hypothetical protein
MKKLITVLTASVGTMFIASVLMTNTAKTLTPESIEKAVRDPDSIKIMVPTVPSNRQITPTCPSAEYQIATFRDNAEGQNMFAQTMHCPKCSLGAISEKDGLKVCSYCESVL